MRDRIICQWLCLNLMLWCLAPAYSAEERTEFRVGGYDKALLDENRLDLEISFALILNEILEQMGAHANFKVYDTFAEASALFADGEMDGMFCSIQDCVDLIQFDAGLPMFSLIYSESPTQEYVLITSQANRSATLSDLRDTTLSIPVGHDLGEHIVDRHLIREQQQPLQRFFSNVMRPDASQTSLIDLVFGKVDAAIVTQNELDLAIALNPQVGESVSVVYVSPPVILNLMALSPKATQERIELFEFVAENIKEYSQTRHMLQLYGASDIIALSPEDLAPTLELLR